MDLPFTLLTQRLLLRNFDLEDAAELYHLNSDPEVLRFTGDVAFENLEGARIFIASYDHYDHYGFGRWVVIERNSGSFLGWCGLKCNEEKKVDLGFRLFRSEWNKGYATEAASACLEYGFNKLELPQIVGRVANENLASIRVLEKTGMTFWKVGNCEGIENSLYYKITQEQFQRSQSKVV